jgi:hypothetical protein
MLPVTDPPFHCYISGWWHEVWTPHPCQLCQVVVKYWWLPSLNGPHKQYYDVLLSLEWCPASVSTPTPSFGGGGRTLSIVSLKIKHNVSEAGSAPVFGACCLFNYKVTKSNNRRVLWNIIHNYQSSTLPTCPAGIACVQHIYSLHHVISMVHSHGTALYASDLETVAYTGFQHVHIFVNIHEWFTYLNLQQAPKECPV